MRLFVALEIPRDVQQLLEAGSRELRRHLPKARWVRSELMHMTLSFLGETEEALLPELDRRLQGAFAPYRPLAMRVADIGAFPPGGRARVLWAGVDTDGDIQGLEAAVTAAIGELRGSGLLGSGLPGEVKKSPKRRRKQKPYHPHITLARCQPPWPAAAVARLVADFGHEHSRSFRVAHGSLVQSELGRGGPRYQTLSTYPLRGGGA